MIAAALAAAVTPSPANDQRPIAQPIEAHAKLGSVSGEDENDRRRDAVAAVEGLLLAANASAPVVDAGCLARLSFGILDGRLTRAAKAAPDRGYVDALIEAARCDEPAATGAEPAPAYPMSRAAWRDLNDERKARYASITSDALRRAPFFAACEGLDADALGIALDQAVVDGDEQPLMIDVANAAYTSCEPSGG